MSCVRGRSVWITLVLGCGRLPYSKRNDKVRPPVTPTYILEAETFGADPFLPGAGPDPITPVYILPGLLFFNMENHVVAGKPERSILT